VADAALQVMGKAGAAQVAGVRNALATAIGGSVQFANCTILGADYV
jgi:acetyl-CoA C-acetyltransferase